MDEWGKGPFANLLWYLGYRYEGWFRPSFSSLISLRTVLTRVYDTSNCIYTGSVPQYHIIITISYYYHTFSIRPPNTGIKDWGRKEGKKIITSAQYHNIMDGEIGPTHLVVEGCFHNHNHSLLLYVRVCCSVPARYSSSTTTMLALHCAWSLYVPDPGFHSSYRSCYACRRLDWFRWWSWYDMIGYDMI